MNSSQLDFVIDYLKKGLSAGGHLDIADFNEKCGIGKNISNEEIFSVVKKIFEDNKSKLEEGVKKATIIDEVKKIIPYVEFLSIK